MRCRENLKPLRRAANVAFTGGVRGEGMDAAFSAFAFSGCAVLRRAGLLPCLKPVGCSIAPRTPIHRRKDGVVLTSVNLGVTVTDVDSCSFFAVGPRLAGDRQGG